MDHIILPSQGVVLTSEKFINTINLKEVIPAGYNVKGILVDFPENLKGVRLLMGNECVAVFDKSMQGNLSKFMIYTALLHHVYSELELVYDKQWLQTQEEYLEEDDIASVVSYGEIVEIFDGVQYRYGRLVHRRKTLTGIARRVITKGVQVKIPMVRFNIEKADPELKTALVSVKQTIRTKDLTDKDIETFIEKYKLEIVGNYGIIMNNIIYADGVARLMYTF
jgi:hypothetical protein